MTATCLEMHADHCSWQREHAMWRDDIELWQEEIQKAREELKQVEGALCDHARALQEHQALIIREEKAVRCHERSLAHHAEEGIAENLMPRTGAHQEQAMHHERLAEAHEYIKRHHHMMLAKLALMRKVLGERPELPE